MPVDHRQIAFETAELRDYEQVPLKEDVGFVGSRRKKSLNCTIPENNEDQSR